ncbi:MAG TPA: transposase [Steroidobacteraceae bacterium]|nr:transposase [Steroidobacteraceae bacterium]
MRYRRSKAKGASFFFTVNLADRSSTALVDHVNELRNVIRRVRVLHPFEITAVVVLPEHLHCIWQLPPGDNDYPTRWSLIKAGFARGLPVTERIRTSRIHKRERGIWQRRYWEHQIRDDEDMLRHIDYIHYNPVKHGHVGLPIDWPFSSLHRYTRLGKLSKSWGAGVRLGDGAYGEVL